MHCYSQNIWVVNSVYAPAVAARYLFVSHLWWRRMTRYDNANMQHLDLN